MNLNYTTASKSLLFLSLMMICITFTSFNPLPHFSIGRYPTNPQFLDTASLWVDSVLNSLSLDEKIAQMIMIPAYSNRDQEHEQEVIDLIKKYKVGGVVFFQGGPVRQAIMTDHFQSVSKTPLLIAMDAEWGLGMRLDSTLVYPRQMMLGAIQDNDLIYQMGHDIARQLKRIGVNINFAPVLDINNNPDNPVINSRSFGEVPENVILKGLAYMQGMQDNGLLCTAKHFPGHGDTESDSHLTLPVIPYSLDRLREVELKPFTECILNGLSGVMAAHLFIPSLDSTPGRASSLSYNIITSLLQKELGFKGLVFTDAMNMKAVSEHNQPGEMEALAVQAGVDIMVMPPDVHKAIQSIRREIRKGTISEDEINRRCRKILAAKKWVGLERYEPADIHGIYEDLNSNDYKSLQYSLVEKSLTLVKNESGLIPVKRLDTLKIASIAFNEEAINTFQQYLELYTDVDHFQILVDSGKIDPDSLCNLLEPYNLIIAGIHRTDMRVTKNYGISDLTFSLINTIARKKCLILSLFANPYSLARIGDTSRIHSIVVGYEENILTQMFAAQLIFGGIPALGKLPVSAGQNFNAGAGISTPDIFRLKYTLPESAGIDSRMLSKIDSLALSAIEQKAIPGCQILAARNGKVFYHRAFGYQTYEKKRPVLLTDIYDVASISKITGTLPSLIMLTDRGKLNVDSTLDAYLPWLDTCDKGNLVIKDVLTHSSGLIPFIPFYYYTIEPMDPADDLISNRLSPRYPFQLSENVYLNKNLKYKDNVYSDTFSEEYPYQVADRLFMNRIYRDSIYYWIINSPLSGKKEYKYSDVGYYFFQQIIEELTDTSLYSYVYHNLYKPLGVNLTGYVPLKRFPKERIAPTENDLYFRKQLLQGYVHDPGTAMMGGIAGHAGVFSNANDLAKIMQMYMQKGVYGGRRYFSEATFDLYNTCIYCNEGIRRGLGFDKPELDPEKEGPTCPSASANSFGHSGFTGTLAWADPDYGIVFVFMSNRVYPDQDNSKLYDLSTRTLIQQVIYDAIINKERPEFR
jgi:beta-glucosidase-like glycosyl hydrolase/CubicO group peptidase (beta-lactamase class C family)